MIDCKALENLDTKQYKTKYLDQWRAVRQLLCKKYDWFISIEYTVETCLRDLTVKHDWDLPIVPSKLYTAIDAIDFGSLNEELKVLVTADAGYDSLGHVRKVIFASLVKHGLMTDTPAKPKGKYVGQCREALDLLIETVPILDRLKADIRYAIVRLNLRYRWPGTISAVNLYLALAAIDFTDELDKLVKVDLGAGQSDYRFKTSADTRALKAKIAKSFLEWGFIVPKGKK